MKSSLLSSGAVLVSLRLALAHGGIFNYTIGDVSYAG
jgi:hypothetical protein